MLRKEKTDAVSTVICNYGEQTRKPLGIVPRVDVCVLRKGNSMAIYGQHRRVFPLVIGLLHAACLSEGRRFFSGCGAGGTPAPLGQEEKEMNALPTIDMIRTGRNIERLRKEAGLSVNELQRILGFATSQAIYKWQQGRSLPTLDNLVALAAVFRVRIDDILVYQKQFPFELIA